MNRDQKCESAVTELKITTATSSYPIYIGADLLPRIDHYLSQIAATNGIKDLLLISNETVYPLYGELVERKLVQSGKNVARFLMPDGEQYKTWDMAEQILSFALQQRLSRQTVVAALGEGCRRPGRVCSSRLFAGSTSGADPTTLLAQVDSSIGGKVASTTPWVRT